MFGLESVVLSKEDAPVRERTAITPSVTVVVDAANDSRVFGFEHHLHFSAHARAVVQEPRWQKNLRFCSEGVSHRCVVETRVGTTFPHQPKQGASLPRVLPGNDRGGSVA